MAPSSVRQLFFGRCGKLRRVEMRCIRRRDGRLGTAGSSPVSPALTAATADELKSVSTSPASSKLLPGGPNQLLAGRDGCRSVEEAADSNTLPALVLAEPDQGSLEYFSVKSAGVKEDGKDYCAAGTRGKADIASILS